mgnify:CR=1 FL=1
MAAIYVLKDDLHYSVYWETTRTERAFSSASPGLRGSSLVAALDLEVCVTCAGCIVCDFIGRGMLV